jgi:hypothetical protein
MGDRTKASYTLQRVHNSQAPGVVYVAVQPVDGAVGEDDHLPCYLPDLHCIAGAAPYPGAGTLRAQSLFDASRAVPAAAGGGSGNAEAPSAAAAGSGQPSKGDTVYVDDVDSAWYGRSRRLMTPTEEDRSSPAPAAVGCAVGGSVAPGAGSSKAAAAGAPAYEPAPAAPQDGSGVFATLSSLLRQRWGT